MGNDSLYLMGLDLGTSCVKGVVMGETGTLYAKAERSNRYEHPREGWVEADAKTHLRDVCGVIRELAAASPGPIRALAASGASGNTLLTDSAGEPLTPIINWMDSRAAETPPQSLSGLTPAAVRKVTGWPCMTSFPIAHLAWLGEHEAERFRQAGRYCMNTDWLLFQWTGQWLMDHSTATTFLLQDQVSGRYHEPYLQRLGISERKLSTLVDSGTSAGRIRAEAARETGLSTDTEIVTGSFDHPSAARAVGVLDPGSLMISCGTSWVGFFPEMDRSRIVEAELLCDPFLLGQGGPWGAMFSVPKIGQTIDAYVRECIAPGEVDPYAIFSEAAAEASPGAEGLRIDLREPMQAVNDSRANISRAVMEGAAHLLKGLLDGLSPHGFRFRSAVMTGGPSRSRVWSDIVGEITGLTLTSGTAHSGAKGAAMLAGLGAGIYRDAADAFNQCASGAEDTET